MQNKILLITGTQNRHLSLAAEIISEFDVDWIQYERRLVPQEEGNNLNHEENVFLQTHLNNLKEDEIKAIGKFDLEELSKKLTFKQRRLLKIKDRKDLNSQSTINWVKEGKYNISIDYGSGILEQRLLEAINCNVINIHGGISPYFKGSSTLLYALLLSQPELAGMTVHNIDSGIDSGDIYRHILPRLDINMSPTEVFAACQKQLIVEINEIIRGIISKKYLPHKQSKYGRTFMARDFRIEMLKNLYINFEKGFLANSIKNINKNIKQYKIYK